MKRKRSTALNANPFLIWTDLALKTTEMLTASAQVISHRTRRMATAGPRPNARDRREFALMGQEKIEALAESSWKMAEHAMSLNPFLGAAAARRMLDVTTAMISLAGSRTPGQAVARQARLVHSLTQSADALSRVSASTGRLAQRGLGPIHSRATANAKRLKAL